MGRAFSYEQVTTGRVPTRLQLETTAEQLRDWLADNEQALTAPPHPVTVHVFGSAALFLLGDRAAMTRRSDIDVAVFGDDEAINRLQPALQHVRIPLYQPDIKIEVEHITPDIAPALNGHYLNHVLEGRHLVFGAPIEQTLPSGSVTDVERLATDAVGYMNDKLYVLGGYQAHQHTLDIDLRRHQRLLELPVAVKLTTYIHSCLTKTSPSPSSGESGQ